MILSSSQLINKGYLPVNSMGCLAPQGQEPLETFFFSELCPKEQAVSSDVSSSLAYNLIDLRKKIHYSRCLDYSGKKIN